MTKNIEEKQLVIPLVKYYSIVRPISEAIVVPYSEVTLNLEFEKEEKNIISNELYDDDDIV